MTYTTRGAAISAGKKKSYAEGRTKRMIGSNNPSFKHGGTDSPTYYSWHNMVNRCYNPKVASFSSYGARGISVCDRWRSDFAAFRQDVGEKPVGKTLDRINNDGNYEPVNCRWATPKEQSANRRDTGKQRYAASITLKKRWSGMTPEQKHAFAVRAGNASTAKTPPEAVERRNEKTRARFAAMTSEQKQEHGLRAARGRWGKIAQ